MGLCQSSATVLVPQGQTGLVPSASAKVPVPVPVVKFKLRLKWDASPTDTHLHSSITPHTCPSRSASTLLLHSPAWHLTQYPTRHGHGFRLRIFRHIGRRSSRRSRESRTKFRLFVLLQDVCPWSVHSRSPPRLSTRANIFPPLERETLQVVRIVSFLPHFGSHPNCYL